MNRAAQCSGPVPTRCYGQVDEDMPVDPHAIRYPVHATRRSHRRDVAILTCHLFDVPGPAGDHGLKVDRRRQRAGLSHATWNRRVRPDSPVHEATASAISGSPWRTTSDTRRLRRANTAARRRDGRYSSATSTLEREDRRHSRHAPTTSATWVKSSRLLSQPHLDTWRGTRPVLALGLIVNPIANQPQSSSG